MAPHKRVPDSLRQWMRSPLDRDLPELPLLIAYTSYLYPRLPHSLLDRCPSFWRQRR